ncbi:MAG: large subunit ribosomal protein L10 [Cellvibrionaceae bacterium]
MRGFFYSGVRRRNLLAISKKRKEELVALYADLIERSDAIFVTKYTGMSVKLMEELRHKVTESKGSFHVTKNTLLAHALEQADLPVPAELLHGQVAATFSLGEAPALAKVLKEHAKKDEFFEISGAVFGSQILDEKGVDTLSTMPTLNELRATMAGLLSGKTITGKLVRLLATPAQDTVSILNNSVKQVLNVLNAHATSESAE